MGSPGAKIRLGFWGGTLVFLEFQVSLLGEGVAGGGIVTL